MGERVRHITHQGRGAYTSGKGPARRGDRPCAAAARRRHLRVGQQLRDVRSLRRQAEHGGGDAVVGDGHQRGARRRARAARRHGG
eukprot:7391300-Prymnesium_polylepis.2